MCKQKPRFCGNIKNEFEEAKIDLAQHPENAQYWAIKLQQYPAAFLKTAIDAIDLSDELIRNWLKDVMLKDEPDKVDKAVSFLSSHENAKVHARHYGYIECRENGLKIILMEDDADLQDKILSVHHAFMITFQQTDAIKIIANSNKKDYIVRRTRGMM